jgi:hypothetical protein
VPFALLKLPKPRFRTCKRLDFRGRAIGQLCALRRSRQKQHALVDKVAKQSSREAVLQVKQHAQNLFLSVVAISHSTGRLSAEKWIAGIQPVQGFFCLPENFYRP